MFLASCSMISLGLVAMGKQVNKMIMDLENNQPIRKQVGFLDKLIDGVEKINKVQKYGKQFANAPKFNEAMIWHLSLSFGFFACGLQKGFVKNLGSVFFLGGFLYPIPKYYNYFAQTIESQTEDFLSILGIFSTIIGWVCFTISYLQKSD